MVANNNSIPPQGTPGVFDPRNPTLLPNFDRSVVPSATKNGGVTTVSHSSPRGFVSDNPRVDATATATIGGTTTPGDEVTIDITNPAFANQGLSPAKISITHLVTSADTTTSIAEEIAAQINDNANAEYADVRADAAGVVVTVRQSGPVGNLTVLSSPLGEGATITCGGTSLTGDQINALFTGPGLGTGVLIQTTPTTLDSATTMGAALALAINDNATLSGLGFVATNSSGAVKITGVPSGDYLVQSWVNKTAPTVVVGGTADAADVLTVTFTATNLPTGSRAVSYTTLVTDTTTALAALGLTNAINADPVLASAGITGSLTGSTIAIAVEASFVGAITYTKSVTGTLTLTASANPTTTAVTTDGQSETVTFSNSGALSGGSGPIFVTDNFTFAGSAGQTQSFWYGQPYVLGFDVLTAMANQGMPII
jgi:hypothetical protein